VSQLLLDVDSLDVRFNLGTRSVHAVQGLTFSVERGQSVAIVGESGSGKTVSSRAIMGLLPEYADVTGSVRFDGVELVGLHDRDMREHRGSDVAMVFQDPARSLDPTMRIGKQISEAIRCHLPLTKSEAKERAIELLEMVRVPAARQRWHEFPHQLSGGTRQRVMIAVALACRPRLLIADEATTALDVTTQAQIMQMLCDLQLELEMSMIIITHDLRLAASYTKDTVVMYAGRAVERAPTKTLFGSLRMPYTKALFDAIPRLERDSHARLPAVPGSGVGAPGELVGCCFNPRCSFVQDRCMTEAPPFEEHEADHFWACWHPCLSEVVG
jgi:oligopeptide/dipeptide ABC transporter ATP-binding protein